MSDSSDEMEVKSSKTQDGKEVNSVSDNDKFSLKDNEDDSISQGHSDPHKQDRMKKGEGNLGEKLDYEVLANISPTKGLDDALIRRQQDEKSAFEALIKENVKLERQLQKHEDIFNQLNAKYEVKCIELDAERGKTMELEKKLMDRENDIKALLQSKRRVGIDNKTPVKDKRKGKSIALSQSTPVDTKEDIDEKQDTMDSMNDNNNKETSPDREIYEQKIKELQSRLVRLSEDDEVKSRHLFKIERELEETKQYTESLEQHVGDDVKEDLKKESHDQSAKPETGFQSWGNQTNTVYTGNAQTFKYQSTAPVKDSVVCVIS